MASLSMDMSASSMAINEDWYEQAIIEYFVDELGYEHLYGPDVKRSSDEYRDVFLPDILPEALSRINKHLPCSAIEEAILKISSVEGGSLEQRNETFADYMQSGVEVHYFDGKEDRDDIVRLFDFDNPTSNDFHVVNQWTFVEYSEKRPDIIIFVNGIPVVLFELKSPSREETDASDAYLQLRNYMHHIPSLFVPNAFCVMSDMAETRVGTITSDEDRYTAWKSSDGDYSNTQAATWTTMLDGMFPKDRLLDIIQNFICFNDTQDKVVKILAAYHQYFAVRKAIVRAKEAVAGDGKIGVFWHTQGSGKSLSMVFFAHLLQSNLESPTIVVITDRNDLDDQLFGQFSRCSNFLRQQAVQADSRKDLKELLVGREANGIIFTTMQKFTDGDEALCDRSNVIVMVDEAHRGQYGLTEKMDASGKVTIGAARLVRKALPNASYIGFTGTPISTDDRNTREIFGDYIDVYDMTQSVEDESTKPVYYESRVVALHLDPDALEKLDAAYEEFANTANDASVEKAKHDLGGLDAIFGTDETIDALCQDIIEHYEKNRADILSGKALIVAYSRPIAMKIYYRMMDLRPEWKEKVGVVMTMSNQDPEEWFEVCGGSSHKKEMERKFKNDKDPLKIAIVVDMWLTGFDVPSLSTMYVFKPMKGHNLMQAIAHFIIASDPSKKVLYVTSETFTNELIESVKTNKNTEFRNKYRNIDVLLIDDIQFIIGKESTQEEFFHTFNSLYQDGKQIVISSDKPPKEMETLPDRLRTRFESGLPVDIQIPTYETKMAIINKKSEALGIDFPYEVKDYVATNITSSIRELEGALTKLSAYSKLSHTPLTAEFAENTLKDLISPYSKKEITPELIIDVVAEHFHIKPEDIISHKRSADIAFPRHIAMYLCRQMTQTPLEAIGKALGGRDHSTILYGSEKIAKETANNETTKSTIDILIKKLNPS